MIPLRDSAAPRRLTPVNLALIAVNLAVFTYELMLGTKATGFVARFAMVPAQVSAASGALAAILTRPFAAGPAGTIAAPLGTMLSSIFLHGGVWHIAGNMLYLFIFGAAVEYRMGSRRYLAFYLASAVAAAIATVAIAPASTVPVIGASGAIAGVLGAYFILYPRGRILTVLPIFVYLQMIEIPAVIYLLLWFGVQLYAGIAAGSRGAIAGGVAWWAHVGGFLFGMLVGPMIARNEKRRRLR
ncbi:MAG TPA: rhomboid family intramembrane serine protease [Candidatus Binataceae bacterium]|nr:rhomboid family intramembrane serine protease [Candidatus Binataceae bacterium]